MAGASETCLVIVGAGASHDCIPQGFPVSNDAVTDHLSSRSVSDTLPPLTKDLVAPSALINQILTRWPPAQAVMDYLRRRVDVSQTGLQATETLEASLAAYQRLSFSERDLHLLGFAMMLRDLLWACTDYMGSENISGGVTNYHTLVHHLLEWTSSGDRDAVVVSFNYDLLLERALEAAWGFNYFDMNAYLNHDRITVLKPHGSIQWGWPVLGATYGGRDDPIEYGRSTIDKAYKGSYARDEFQVLPWPTHNWPAHPTSGPLLVPAMALPFEGKSEFAWPEAHRERLDKLQGAVSLVLVVGWRALDDHLLSLLGPFVREDARVLIVSGGASLADAEKEASQIAHRIQSHLDVPLTRFEVSGLGFKGSVANLVPEFMSSRRKTN